MRKGDHAKAKACQDSEAEKNAEKERSGYKWKREI